ncbi:MAG TPA: hypothetical protein PLT73_08845 [Trichococcus flocculiformis]|nr:hypothetical protein [Trichococcus flocculiformis]
MVRAKLVLVFALGLTAWSAQSQRLQPHADSTNTPSRPYCTQSKESADGIIEPSICELQLPLIAKIEVHPKPKGFKQPSDEPDCRTFQPAGADILRFFAHAGSVNEQDWMHQLDLTRCHVSGAAYLIDGRKAKWTVYPSRMGRINIEGDKSIFLYCPGCSFKPFW